MKKIFGYLLKICLFFVSLVLLHLLACFVLAILPATDANKRETGEVAIFVKTDGFHTELILPTQTNSKDWHKQIQFDQKMNYTAFGWGDRGFYLGTPNASDFQVSVAFKALFYLGTSVVHLTQYTQIIENEQCKKLWLTAEEYQNLVKFIENTFLPNAAGKLQPILTNTYSKRHLFFQARGRYSLFYTCNTWVGEGLKTCKQPTCIWTPFASGLFYHL